MSIADGCGTECDFCKSTFIINQDGYNKYYVCNKCEKRFCEDCESKMYKFENEDLEEPKYFCYECADKIKTKKNSPEEIMTANDIVRIINTHTQEQSDRIVEFFKYQNKKIEELESLALDNLNRLMENANRGNEAIENTERIEYLLKMVADEIKTAIIQKLEEITKINVTPTGTQPSININIGGKDNDK